MNVRGREKVVMVSDCMMAGGMTEGTYQLGEFPVKVKDGMARLESGSLAGSILQLKDAVKMSSIGELPRPSKQFIWRVLHQLKVFN